MDAWLEANNHYLEASLRWLRLCLRRLIPEEPVPPPVATQLEPPQEAAPRARGIPRLSRWMKVTREAAAAKEPLLLPEGKPVSLEEQIREAALEREKAAQIEPPPALVLLARQWFLSDFERDTLLLCAAVEFDPEFATRCGAVQGHARSYPTFGLALSAFSDPNWEGLAAHRPLRQSRLLEISQPGATPLTSAPLRADERIVNFLKGLNVFDDRLATLFMPVDEDEAINLSESQYAVVETILQHLQYSVEESSLPVVQLLGSDSGSKVAVARQACALLNRRLYCIGAEALPTQVSEIETLALLWQRETVLLPVSLYIDAENLDTLSPEAQAALQRFLSRSVGLVFVGAREAPVRLTGLSFPIDVSKPTTGEQYEAWEAFLDASEAETKGVDDAEKEGKEAEVSASETQTAEAEPEAASAAAMLAGQFNLNFGDIRRAVSLASKMSTEEASVTEHLWTICRDLTRPRLNALAQHLDAKATWDDLVLPEEQMKLMQQIAGQVRERRKVYDVWGFSRMMNRGFGISALFAGESGTGKTMAAEVLANDLKLNLYRIDLSAVVSKYIGETEKNLRRLFDAAECGGAILFFDEADALFGKRSEVKDSHDRYANIEINYLLQRMEAFSGLAILATNMKGALDTAFMRRLRFIVKMPFPSQKERRLIWEKALPPETPTKELDYDRLARLNIAGGNIHSIALNAAFMAAQNGQAVTMETLLAAARAEFRKLEKPFNESEFLP